MKLINLRTLNTYKVQQHLSGWIFRKTQINQQKVKQNLNYQFIVVYEFTELSSVSIIRKPNSSIERLSECGLDSVEESHGVRDAVEGQNTCTVIQVHSNSAGQRTWDGSLDFVVMKVITVIVTI